MEVPVNEIVTGRKCFFIVPDTSLMPVTFLEDFFSLGYECYYIGNDTRVPVQKKIESILSLFNDVIIFVNIDYEVPGIRWPYYLQDLFEKKDSNASNEKFGIMFSKRQSAAENEIINKHFFKILGLKRGFIQLEYQKKYNFELIARALFNNQAQGRRKTIRALCSSACTYKFFYGEKNTPFSGSLQDISLSHFTILIKDEPLPVKLYEKISDIHFNIRGSFFHSDATLVMERPVGENMLYVFSFVTSTGAGGLDARTRSILVPVLYNMISANCLGLLEQYYHKDDGTGKTEAAVAPEENNDLYVTSETEANADTGSNADTTNDGSELQPNNETNESKSE